MRLPIRSIVARFALLALILPLFVACQSEEERIAELRERSSAYVEEEQFEEAVIELKSILQLDPNDAAAHFELAKIYIGLLKRREAFWELTESVRLDPSNKEARLALAQLSLLSKNYEEVVAQAEGVIEIDPDDADAYVLQGRGLDVMDRREEAEAAFLKAVELEPENGSFLVILAGHYAGMRNLEAAESALLKSIELDPSFRAYTNLARLLMSQTGRTEESEVAFRSALSNADPEDKGRAWRNLAKFQNTVLQNLGEAITTLEQAVADADVSPEEKLEMLSDVALRYEDTGDSEKAKALLEAGPVILPDSPKPYLILSVYRGSRGDSQGALEEIRRALEIEPENLEVRVREVEVLAEMGFRLKDEVKIAEARSMIEKLIEENPSNPNANLALGKILLSQGQHDEAMAPLQTAIDGRPDWAEAHFALGSALMARKETSSARAELARAIELDGGLLEARRTLAQLHATLGEHEYAIEQARAYLSRRPGAIETQLLLTQSLARIGRVDEAIKELEGIPEDQRGVDVIFALGRLYLVEQNTEKAREFLLRANEMKPNYAGILTSLTSVDRSLGRADEAYARLEAAVKANPDDAKLAVLVGQEAFRRGDLKLAEESFERAIELDANLLEAYEQLAVLYRAQGRLDAAIDTYQIALKTQPDSARLNQFVALLFEMSGNTESAIQHYERAIGLDPSLGNAKNNLAYLLAEQNRDLDRALDLAQDAKALMPESVDATDTLGWVLFKRGTSSAAVGYLKEAVANSPADAPGLNVMRHHLAQAYVANNQQDKAIEVLEEMLSALELQMTEASQQGGNPREPAWAVEARSMLENLKSGT